MKQLKLWVLIVGMSVLSACGSKVEETQQVAEQQQAATSLKTVKAEASTAPALHYLDGHVEAVNQSTISAQTSGVIEKLFYDVDDFVEQGKVIARIKSKSQQAGVEQAKASQSETKASYAEAQANYTEAKASYDRASEIYGKRLIPKAELENAEAALQAAEARVKAAEARMSAATAQVTQAGEQLGYTTLVAPYGGIVTKRHVELGEAVNPGTPIMTGISLNEMRVTVEVPQRLITQVRKEKKAFVFQDGSYKSLPVRALTFFPYADPKTNAFKVRIDLAEGAQDLFPGMFVKVAFVMGQQEGVVSVPESAVVVRSEVIGVYVINADGLPSLRQIRLGRKLDENNISVLAGLDAGETIALDPVQAAIFLKQQTVGAKHDE